MGGCACKWLTAGFLGLCNTDSAARSLSPTASESGVWVIALSPTNMQLSGIVACRGADPPLSGGAGARCHQTREIVGGVCG